jgi:hypothetical protein
MAIQLDLAESQFGVPFRGYFRIVTANISRTRFTDLKFRVMIDVAGYATTTPEPDTKEVDFRRYHVPLDEIESQEGDTFLAKCYKWVMAQDGMIAALEV